MPVQLIKVFAPLPIATPRGAEWASGMAIRLAEIGSKVRAAIERAGHARAQRELDRLALRHAHNPALAQALLDVMNRGNRG